MSTQQPPPNTLAPQPELIAEKEVQVLDLGFVRLIEFMGGDLGVVRAARVSYGTGSKGEEKDRKLIAYLIKHEHMTPFEHAIFKFHIKCPIFVARQWFRHRIGSYELGSFEGSGLFEASGSGINEISGRYVEVPDEFYVPNTWRAPDSKNKQGSQATPQLDQKKCHALMEKHHQQSFSIYRQLLEAGVAREMARMVLPLSLYTQFYWTANARSLMNFIALRADAAAQWEIQQYAEAITDLFAQKMPWTWESFLSFVWEGSNPNLNAQKQKLLEISSIP
ncbi:MAG: FAD-dependent thymidylate synthase [Elusimicrobia bacterium]|nr:FAD-dependent thymidylate synthase [Elusimicrobiota bacterium]